MRMILGMSDTRLLMAAMKLLFFKKIAVIENMTKILQTPSDIATYTADREYRTFYFTDSELRQASDDAKRFLLGFFTPPGNLSHDLEKYEKILILYSEAEMLRVFELLKS